MTRERSRKNYVVAVAAAAGGVFVVGGDDGVAAGAAGAAEIQFAENFFSARVRPRCTKKRTEPRSKFDPTEKKKQKIGEKIKATNPFLPSRLQPLFFRTKLSQIIK